MLTGLETRTSSPIRLLRGKEDLLVYRALPGLYPCGEGAGYAGGIMTAAVDGVRCAAELMKQLGTGLINRLDITMPDNKHNYEL